MQNLVPRPTHKTLMFGCRSESSKPPETWYILSYKISEYIYIYVQPMFPVAKVSVFTTAGVKT